MAALDGRGWRLATAESLTGGGLGAAFTAVPGASRVYAGGVVAYQAAAKVKLLGVPAGLIARQGMVNAEVAARMAEGVRELLDADLGLSTTGLAGPEGDGFNPVGTVWIGLALRGRETATRRLDLAGSRTEIRARAVAAALEAALAAGRGPG